MSVRIARVFGVSGGDAIVRDRERERVGPAMSGMRAIHQAYRPHFSVLISCIVFSAVSLLAAQTAGDQLEAIGLALRNREFDRALDLLRPQLKASPESAQLWTIQGKAYAGMQKTKNALTSFETALKIDPDYIPALQGEAQIGFDTGDAAAIPALQHLLRLRKDDKISHGMLAVLEYKQGNCAAAVPHFEQAGDLFDSQIDALHAYAICQVKLKKVDLAAKVFERALAIAPENAEERQLLASVQLMDHQPQAAVATLMPLLKSGSPQVGALELASSAYEDAHDTERAVELLRQAILEDPTNVNLYLDFANISSVHQSFQVGINVVDDGISQQPEAAPLYFARGVLNVQLGQYDQAQADFEKAYELDPNQSLSVAAQGLAAVNANDVGRALTTVQSNLKKKPNDPILLYLQAEVLTQMGAAPGSPEFQLAMHSVKKAVALRPTLGPARAVLAKLYLQAGQYREAVEQCHKAIEIDPKDQTSLYRLIQALRKSGNNHEVPDLLKRLSLLRQEATKEEREHYRYKLVEGGALPAQSTQP
jgi:tetratricopeptide (TPR) repeat protein